MPNAMALQMAEPWHRQGLYMGMHWGWWLFWIVTIAVVVWAFARLQGDRNAAKNEAARQRKAEAELRERFQRGELDAEQLRRELAALITAGGPRTPG